MNASTSRAEDALLGCYKKDYDVSPSGHIIKLPAGVTWTFKILNKDARLEAVAESVACRMPFTLDNVTINTTQVAFDQINDHLEGHFSLKCLTMLEFTPEQKVHWSGYFDSSGGIRISYTDKKNRRRTSSWSKLPCENL